MKKTALYSGLMLAALLTLGSCRSMDSGHETSQARASVADLDRMTVAQLVDELINQNKLLRQSLTNSQGFRGQVVTHFIDSALRRQARYSNPTEFHVGVLALAHAQAKIVWEKSIAPWTETPTAETAALEQMINTTLAKLDAKTGFDPEMVRVYDTAAQVSFMRFLMNRTVSNMKTYVESLPNGPTRTQFARWHNSLRSQKGNIAYLSAAMKNPKDFSNQLSVILKAPIWKDMKKIYIPLAGSSEVEGMTVDFAVAENIKLGAQTVYWGAQEMRKSPPLKMTTADNYQFDPVVNGRTPAQEDDDEAVSASSAKLPAMKYANLVLIGNVPGQYLGKDKNTYGLAAVEIKDRVIISIKALQEAEVAAASKPVAGKQIVVLKNGAGYDVMYPGLIDLHNHTKQNNLPVWGEAKGQFENRFEWRGWGNYTKAVSQNMNPWIQFGKPIECAAFRWSELKTMILGTTYLQGPSNCVENFSIQRVEDGKAYVSQKDSVQAPTDLIYPNEMQFVWSTLRPDISRGQNYEQALSNAINKYCPGIKGVSAATVNTPEGLKILKDKDLLTATCPEPLPKGFVRYVYWIHPTIAGRKNYFKGSNPSAVIAHLAEGRRRDAYNNREMELVAMLGLDYPHMNFVHGVGITPNYLSRLASKDMGLIWSPFSNLLLYAETMDILAAHKAGVKIALGSDWLPTGSKGVLEEVKLAAQYVDKDPQLKAVFNDEYLFKMMTENPAKMINHWDNKSAGGKVIEAGVGQLAVGSMGSVIVTSIADTNPYTNLVRKVNAEDVNLVVIDGNVMYGNEAYVKQAGLSKYEVLSQEFVEIEKVVPRGSVPTPPADTGKEAKAQHLAKLGSIALTLRPSTNSFCKFNSPKVFVNMETVAYVPELDAFKKASGMNLDRFADIQRLLALSALTQSKNLTAAEGDPRFALTYFPSLYSCNDSKHTNRIQGMVRATASDEWTANVSARNSLRTSQKLGKLPQTLGEAYK